MEYQEIKTKSAFLEYVEPIAGFVKRVLDKNPTGANYQHTLESLYRWIGSPDCFALLQFKDKEPISFGVGTICSDIQFNRVGLLWLVAAKPGADSREGMNIILEWFKINGINEVFASDYLMKPWKDKWFQQRGFKRQHVVYVKEV